MAAGLVEADVLQRRIPDLPVDAAGRAYVERLVLGLRR